MSNLKRLFVALAVAAPLALPVFADEVPERPRPKPEKKSEQPESEVKLPWTAEDVKADWKRGRVYNFNVTVGGKPGTAVMKAVEVTDTGFTMSSVLKVEDSEQTEEPKKKTWAEHVESLKTQLTRAETEEVELEVKAGKYACTCYTVTIPTRAVTRTQKYWLSKSVPGMFVKAERTELREDSKRVDSWELTSVDVPRIDLPWSQKQIQEAWSAGISMKYAIETEAGDSGWARMTISDVNADGFTQTRTVAAEGKPEKTDEPRVTTWDRYLREMAVPSHNASVSEESLETPAGKFDCVVVTVIKKHERGSGTQKLYFSKKDPGVVVKMSIVGEQNGKPDKEIWTLTELKKGQ